MTRKGGKKVLFSGRQTVKSASQTPFNVVEFGRDILRWYHTGIKKHKMPAMATSLRQNRRTNSIDRIEHTNFDMPHSSQRNIIFLTFSLRNHPIK